VVIAQVLSRRACVRLWRARYLFLFFLMRA
jgi:hypothetical protein